MFIDSEPLRMRSSSDSNVCRVSEGAKSMAATWMKQLKLRERYEKLEMRDDVMEKNNAEKVQAKIFPE